MRPAWRLCAPDDPVLAPAGDLAVARAHVEAAWVSDGDGVGEARRKHILRFVDDHPDALLRSCVEGHLTGSAMVVDPASRQVLMLLHSKVRRWLQPGGHADGDAALPGVALREAEEETGLDPAGVVPLALLPRLHLPPSGFLVTPVLAHWARPVAVHAVDPAETAAVVRVPVAELTEPANRIRVGHSSGMVGNAFVVADLLVWGFTGALLSALLDMGGWARPWDETRVLDLDSAWSAARSGWREVAEP